MNIAIIPIEVFDLSSTASLFNISESMHGLIIKCKTGKNKVILVDKNTLAEYLLGEFNSLKNTLKAISDIYLLLAEHDKQYCINKIKSCLEKHKGIDLRNFI